MTRQRGPDGRFVSKTITAAASVIPTRSIENMPRTAEGWQMRAWRLWRLLGVVHFPTSFKAKQVGSLGWNVEVNGEQLDEDAAAEALEAVTAPLGTAEAARRLALNLEVAGQVFYARASDEWKVYAATTPKLKELLAAADIRVEGLQPDPEEPTKPTSSIQAALGTAEQIRLMAQMSRNQDRNRLAQRGILLVPKEGQFPEGDDFQANLEEAMTAPIADEYAPSSVVPIKVDFPGDYIEKWRHLVIESPYDDKLMDRIEATVRQFAREIDMPPEMLLGNIDSNHWNAWLSSEENYRGHVQPLGVLVGQVFAQALMESVGASEFAGADIVVTPDPSSMLAHRPTVEDAFKALEWAVVGFDFVRRAIGADEEDAPTDEEIERILVLKGLAPQVAPEDPTQQAPAMPQEMPDDMPANGNGTVTAAAQSEQALDALAHQLSDLDQQMRGRLHAASEMAADMILDSIEDPDAVGMADQVAERIQPLGTMWSREIDSGRRALRGLGIDSRGEEWDAAQAASVEMLTDGMTAYVLSQVGKVPSERAAVPGDLLREVLATAGGSGSGVVAALLPPPTTRDALGFAVGVLSSKQLERQGVRFTQWRFRYGTLHRSEPFVEHKAQDGRFATVEGTVNGWYPGDHKGCLCGLTPVLRPISTPEGVT